MGTEYSNRYAVTGNILTTFEIKCIPPGYFDLQEFQYLFNIHFFFQIQCGNLHGWTHRSKQNK